MSQLGYQTQYTDPDSGDVLMQSRWYSPTSGTFRSRDTYAGNLNTPVTLNRYTYAGNNPIRYSDPSGRCYEIWAPGCTAAIATAGVNFPGLRITEVQEASSNTAGELAVSLENGLHVASLGFDAGGQPTTAGEPFWVDKSIVPANNTHFDFEVATSGSEADQLFVEHRTKCAKSGNLTDPSCGAIYELANEVSASTVSANFTDRCHAAVSNCFNASGQAEVDHVVLAVIEEAVTLGTLKAFRAVRGAYSGARAAAASGVAGHAASSVDNTLARLRSVWGGGPGIAVSASAAGPAGPMQVVRAIQHGENLPFMLREVDHLTKTTGLEHAIISQVGGGRVIVNRPGFFVARVIGFQPPSRAVRWQHRTLLRTGRDFRVGWRSSDGAGESEVGTSEVAMRRPGSRSSSEAARFAGCRDS